MYKADDVDFPFAYVLHSQKAIVCRIYGRSVYGTQGGGRNQAGRLPLIETPQKPVKNTNRTARKAVKKVGKKAGTES